MSSTPPPGDASNDPTTDQTGRFVRQPNGRIRPLSPHLQIWRFHVTMWGSILNRGAAVGLSFGLLFVVGWMVAAACGPDAYAAYAGCMGSPLGLLIWFLITLAAAYHLTAGIRHLVWDAGEGLAIKPADQLTVISMVAAVVLTVGFWAALFLSGKVVL